MISKKTIYNLLTKNKGKYSTVINWLIILLILLSVPLDGFESYLGTPYAIKKFIIILDFLISIIFAFEYILRLYSCTENPKYARPFIGRIKYALTPLMLLDLLAMPPYIMLGYGYLRALRAFRILMLARYTKAVQVIEAVIRNKAQEILIISGFFIMLWGWSAMMIFRFENPIQPQTFRNLFDALWWSVGTFTTIGYGDMVPISLGGKIIAIITMICGPILFGLSAAVLTSGIIERLKNAAKEKLP